MTMQAAQSARQSAALDKRYRAGDGTIYTLRERLSADYYAGKRTERNVEAGRSVYYLVAASDASRLTMVPKFVYDYAGALVESVVSLDGNGRMQ